MNNNFKLKLLAAAVLMASGVAHAGSAFLNGSPTGGDGSQANPYDFGVVGTSVSALFVNIGGPANGLLKNMQTSLFLHYQVLPVLLTHMH